MSTAQERLASYTGGLHLFRDYMKDKWEGMKDQENGGRIKDLRRKTGEAVQDMKDIAVKYLGEPEENEEFAHIYRNKTRFEIIRISAAVMGIEFCYAAETAFVSPTLLKIGVEHRLMTLIWCLSPAVGFFLTPVLGSLSDKCTLGMGRRRPFILLLSVGILLGLILIPNGKLFGILLGDTYADSTPYNVSSWSNQADNDTAYMDSTEAPPMNGEADHHPWGIFFTILGTILLDFDADACQSPSRAYLLDVTLPEDHAVGLSTFTIMAGLGGGTGYAMGAIDWDTTVIGWLFGGHVRAVFTIVLFIYIICVMVTVTSFKEIPLKRVKSVQTKKKSETEKLPTKCDVTLYGAVNGETAHTELTKSNGIQMTNSSTVENQETCFNNSSPTAVADDTPVSPVEVVPDVTLKHYLLSIVHMPKSLRILCLTNLFSWMSLVCYSLYFTDFVGEAVFEGDPSAPEGSPSRVSYEEGVRFGCWGMCLYSISCAIYSAYIETLVKRFGARPVYFCGQLVYSIGMIFLCIFPHKVSVIVLSTTAGVMYSTLFTMPYLLVANYHEKQTVGFERSFISSADEPQHQVRGLGTDVAIVSSMVFLAQFIQALCMGTFVEWVGSTVAIVAAAAVFAFCAAVASTQAVYLDL